MRGARGYSRRSWHRLTAAHYLLEYLREVHGEEFSARESEISIERYWYRF
jgi:hypothetical protein